MQVRNYSDEFRVFHRLKRLSDFTVVLDDNSFVPFPFKDECDIYLTQKSKGWNCTANLTTLFYQAFTLGADWMLRMDDDMLLGDGLQTAQQIHDLIHENNGNIIGLQMRDLWGDLQHYRSDGVWGAKSFPFLTLNFFKFHSEISVPDPFLKLHQRIWPTNVVQKIVHAKPVLYHTGCLTPQDRSERFVRYSTMDATNRYQSDYRYMVDERGLTLAEVPPKDLTAFGLEKYS